jgi:hypothetical protein
MNALKQPYSEAIRKREIIGEELLAEGDKKAHTLIITMNFLQDIHDATDVDALGVQKDLLQHEIDGANGDVKTEFEHIMKILDQKLYNQQKKSKHSTNQKQSLL